MDRLTRALKRVLEAQNNHRLATSELLIANSEAERLARQDAQGRAERLLNSALGMSVSEIYDRLVVDSSYREGLTIINSKLSAWAELVTIPDRADLDGEAEFVSAPVPSSLVCLIQQRAAEGEDKAECLAGRLAPVDPRAVVDSFKRLMSDRDNATYNDATLSAHGVAYEFSVRFSDVWEVLEEHAADLLR